MQQAGRHLQVDVAVIDQQYLYIRQAQTALTALQRLHVLALLVDEACHRVVEAGAGHRLVQHQIHLLRAGTTHQLVLGIGGRHDDDG
ncbi:hypothetical protein D3C78_1189240 [compost metagenome]